MTDIKKLQRIRMDLFKTHVEYKASVYTKRQNVTNRMERPFCRRFGGSVRLGGRKYWTESDGAQRSLS